MSWGRLVRLPYWQVRDINLLLIEVFGISCLLRPRRPILLLSMWDWSIKLGLQVHMVGELENCINLRWTG